MLECIHLQGGSRRTYFVPRSESGSFADCTYLAPEAKMVGGHRHECQLHRHRGKCGAQSHAGDIRLTPVFMVSLQALTGTDYPGAASRDILDNVLPFIDGEEEKLGFEPHKILGNLSVIKLVLADFTISAHCIRVSVSIGHLVCLTVELDRKIDS
jgi:hypothetical protein